MLDWTMTMAAPFSTFLRKNFPKMIRTVGFATLAGALLSGCESTTSSNPPVSPGPVSNLPPIANLTLMSGDEIQITFPGAPDLNISQTIRRDGRIDLPLIDEVEAVGMTPDELEDLLMKLYEPQLVTSEVLVTVISSNIAVFVSGSVGDPGKIMVNRRITALEAIMEAGGPIVGRSNLKSVVVIRDEGGVRRNYKVNIKDVLDGKPVEPFILQSSDIVYVPELKF